MFFIIQSNDTDTLVDYLIDFYKNTSKNKPLSCAVFDPFMVIVPSMVLGDWLTKQVALKLGVSTLFTAEFWGKYQWQMTQKVLEMDKQMYPNEAMTVPEVAVLSASIMRWRIFGFVSMQLQQAMAQILGDEAHPLHMLIKPLYDQTTQSVPEQRLWQVSDELSRVYVRYLTHRPSWLLAWANGQPLQEAVRQMMSDKANLEKSFGAPEDDAMPEWLQSHYLSLECLLRYVWHTLFAKTYLYRMALEERFWQVLSGERGFELSERAKAVLPSTLYLFTVQQIPQVELDFLKRLSLYLQVVLLHFNPSMMFWADIVDKNWLLTQRIIKPQSVYLRDYGHALLSRLGKESRETFAMLADMSGGADDGDWVIDWQERFVRHYDKKPTLLNALKQDILMLGDDELSASQTLTGHMLTLIQDDEALIQKSRPKVSLPLEMVGESIAIHACHSLKRQLEIARLMIAKYLNEPSDKQRTLSDVVVLLPDVAAAQELILSVFPQGQGMDGLTLPIKITGTTDKSIDELLYAIANFYALLGEPSGRFYASDVYEWLLTPALYESFGLSFYEMKRGCELLTKAGFHRGFDEVHLAQTLDGDDLDYRFSFSYALDRVVLGLVAPSEGRANTTLHPFSWHKEAFAEAVLPLEGVSLADEKIINALVSIHEGLNQNRHEYHKVAEVEVLLEQIEHDVIRRYFAPFHQTIAMRAIFNSKNAMKASLRANKHYHRGGMQAGDKVMLSLKFVLDSWVSDVKAQALSAEPAEVITFARFGALRSIPFGLTIMLDMNISSFPRQDRVMRLDLMRAGAKQRGDRYHEDDDNGAFLDALLCSKDRVLIFYNGMSADGQTELLPASVVGELLQYFKTDALWHAHAQDGQVYDIHKNLPKLLEDFLITKHEAYAFEEGVFYEHTKNKLTDPEDLAHDPLTTWLYDRLLHIKQRQKQALPPPTIWRLIRQALERPPHKMPTLTLPEAKTLSTIAQTLSTITHDGLDGMDFMTLGDESVVPYHGTIDELSDVIIRPAKAFLNHRLKFLSVTDGDGADEPLGMDALQNYTLNHRLIQMAKAGKFDGISPTELDKAVRLQNNNYEHTNQLQIQDFDLKSLYYGELLPAGVPRLTTTGDKLKIFEDKMTNFVATMTKIDDETLKHHFAHYSKERHEYSTWLTPTSERVVSFVLANQPITLTGQLPIAGSSLWLNLLPKTAKAKHLVKFWIDHLCWQACDDTQHKTSVWQFYQASDEVGFKNKTIFMLEPINATLAKSYLYQLIHVAKLARQMPLVMTCRGGMNFAKNQEIDKRSLESWLNFPTRGYVDESNSHHEYWQFILKNDKPKERLLECLPIANLIYQPMFLYLKAINHE